MKRQTICEDCAFNRVEPAICAECRDASQFQETTNEDSEPEPIYFTDWKDL